MSKMRFFALQELANRRPVKVEILYLVFHQGYQGGNHQAHSFFGKCRDLESNGLAATRRHQSQGILILADAVDDIFLDTPKTVISPILL